MDKGRVGRSGNSSFFYNSEIFGKHNGGPQSFEIISERGYGGLQSVRQPQNLFSWSFVTISRRGYHIESYLVHSVLRLQGSFLVYRTSIRSVDR